MTDEQKKKALEAFYTLMDKVGNDHNMYVQLEIDGKWQYVPVWELLHQKGIEAERRAVEKIKQKLLDIAKFEHGFYTNSELFAIKAVRYDGIVNQLAELDKEGKEA